MLYCLMLFFMLFDSEMLPLLYTHNIGGLWNLSYFMCIKYMVAKFCLLKQRILKERTLI